MKLFKSIELDGETHYQDLNELCERYKLSASIRKMVEEMGTDTYIDTSTIRIRRVE